MNGRLLSAPIKQYMSATPQSPLWVYSILVLVTRHLRFLRVLYLLNLYHCQSLLSLTAIRVFVIRAANFQLAFRLFHVANLLKFYILMFGI